jgi:hypothetical protein
VKKILNPLVVTISLITVIAGTTQMAFPGFVLGQVGAETTQSTALFFAIIGMFMFLFGALMLHNVYSAMSDRGTALWCALQKIGASIAIALGIYHGVFSLLALGVALFDLFSGVVFLIYRKNLRTDAGH